MKNKNRELVSDKGVDKIMLDSLLEKFANKCDIAVLGDGQLGSAIYKYWAENKPKRKHELEVFSRKTGFDFNKEEDLIPILQKYEVIINCVAYTNVDGAEANEEICKQTNFESVKRLSDLCKKFHRILIHISSEVVYADDNPIGKPLKEDEQFKTPTCVYSKWKAEADKYVLSSDPDALIIRSGWLFNPQFQNNFIAKITNKILSGDQQVRVVDDQIGTLTSAELIAKVIFQWIESDIPGGVYNIGQKGYVSRYEIAKYIRDLLRRGAEVVPCKADEYVRPAKVARNSRLDLDKYMKDFRQIEYPDYWKISVTNMLKENGYI